MSANAVTPSIITARKYASGTAQTVTAATLTTVSLATLDYNRGSVIGTGTANTLTATLAGVYFACATIDMTGAGTGMKVTIITVNGTIRVQNATYSTAIETRGQAADVIVLAAGDLVTVQTFSSTGNLTIGRGTTFDTGLTLTWMGP